MKSSKQRRNRKSATAGAILLAVMLAASACGNANTNNTANGQQGTVNEGTVVDGLPTDNGVVEPDVSTPEPTADSSNNTAATDKPATDKVIVAEGTYIGLSDSHSIEIETASGPVPLQITEEQAKTLEDYPSDAKVKFEYTEKAIDGEANLKQNWLTKIEQVK